MEQVSSIGGANALHKVRLKVNELVDADNFRGEMAEAVTFKIGALHERIAELANICGEQTKVNAALGKQLDAVMKALGNHQEWIEIFKKQHVKALDLIHEQSKAIAELSKP